MSSVGFAFIPLPGREGLGEGFPTRQLRSITKCVQRRTHPTPRSGAPPSATARRFSIHFFDSRPRPRSASRSTPLALACGKQRERPAPPAQPRQCERLLRFGKRIEGTPYKPPAPPVDEVLATLLLLRPPAKPVAAMANRPLQFFARPPEKCAARDKNRARKFPQPQGDLPPMPAAESWAMASTTPAEPPSKA
jgi:hypothetical protein